MKRIIKLIELLGEEFYVIIVALWLIGYACRRTPFIPKWLVTWIVLGAGLFISCTLFGWNMHAVLNGVIASTVALFGQQIIQKVYTTKGRNDDYF